jgi:thiol-disulfide isomerase/thioredoxin
VRAGGEEKGSCVAALRRGTSATAAPDCYVPRVFTVLCLSALVAGCAGAAPEPKTASKASKLAHLERVREPIDIWGLRFVGMDDGAVPPFRLHTTDKSVVDSSKLVGERPFAFVFFATWCSVCDRKLDALKAALAGFADFTVIGISVDDDSTWSNVPSYLRHHGVDVPVVAALEHPSFSIAYNPFSTVPLVVIVGRNGGLVDYQLGYEADDVRRLTSSFELARTIGPLAKPHG